MSRTNKCKICGWDGGLVPDKLNQPSWVGTNHNLCSACVPARQAQIEADPSDYRNGWRRTMRTSPLAALASAFLPGARP